MSDRTTLNALIVFLIVFLIIYTGTLVSLLGLFLLNYDTDDCDCDCDCDCDDSRMYYFEPDDKSTWPKLGKEVGVLTYTDERKKLYLGYKDEQLGWFNVNFPNELIDVDDIACWEDIN